MVKKVVIGGNGGQGNEPWYKSRRILASIFVVIVSILTGLVNLEIIPGNVFDAFSPALGLVAGYLGITSWRKPK